MIPFRSIIVMLLLAALLVPGYGQEEKTLTIIYSGSLNGNLDGCFCESEPRAGLVKRAAWIKALPLEKRSQCIFVDTGDILSPIPDPVLSEQILEIYKELGYSAVAVGDQEFANGIEVLLDYSNRFPFICNNLAVCLDENRCIFISIAPLILEIEDLRVGLFSLIDSDVFALHPDDLRKRLKIASPEVVAENIVFQLQAGEIDVDLVILLYHGHLDHACQLIRMVDGIQVAIIGHEQRLIEAERIAGTIVASPGEEGNRVGILDLTIEGGQVTSFRNRFHLFSYATDSDDPEVRARIEDYKDKLRENSKKR